MNEDIELMIDDCLARSKKMNSWEYNFIESLREQYDVKGELSEAQVKKLDDIWERVTWI